MSNNATKDERGNIIICDSDLNGSTITFAKAAKNNLIIIEKNALLYKSKFKFLGSNSLIYIKPQESKALRMLNIEVYNNASFFMGLGTSVKTKNVLRSIVASNTNVFLGNDNMLSEKVLIRTNDAHNIFDQNKEVMNAPASIMLGDHVWVGQEIIIAKSSFIGSGSVVGAGSRLFGNKDYKSNTVIGGFPAKTVKDFSVWHRNETHYKLNVPSNIKELDDYTYAQDEHTISMREFDERLIAAPTAEAKRDIIDALPQAKNRFYVAGTDIQRSAKSKALDQDRIIAMEEQLRKTLAIDRYAIMEDRLALEEHESELAAAREQLEAERRALENARTKFFKLKTAYEDSLEPAKLYVTDLYWEDTYLHIWLNLDTTSISLYRKKNKETIVPEKLEPAHFRVNAVNVDTARRVLYGEYIFRGPGGGTLRATQECILKLSNLDKSYRFSKEYMYMGFFKNQQMIPLLNFQCYSNTPIEEIKPYSIKNKTWYYTLAEKLVYCLLPHRYNAGAKKIDDKNPRVLLLTLNGDAIGGNLLALEQYLRNNEHTNKLQIDVLAYNVFRMRKRNIMKLYYKLSKQLGAYKYIFVDNYTPIFNYIDLVPGQELVQLWHAGVGFKSVGYGRFGKNGSPHLLFSPHRKYTKVLAPTEKIAGIYSGVFGVAMDKFIITGLPRLEGMLERRDEILRQVYEHYPHMATKRNILFAPTFRGTGQREANYPLNKWLNLDEIDEFCREHDMNFLIRLHPFVKKIKIKDTYTNIYDASDYPDSNELLMASQAIVSDYSSIVYEATLFNVPIRVFAPDDFSYELTRGVHRTLAEFCDNEVSRDTAQLLESFEDLVIRDWQIHFRSEVEEENAHACETIVRKVMGDDFVPAQN